jgi:hypothetical protein
MLGHQWPLCSKCIHCVITVINSGIMSLLSLETGLHKGSWEQVCLSSKFNIAALDMPCRLPALTLVSLFYFLSAPARISPVGKFKMPVPLRPSLSPEPPGPLCLVTVWPYQETVSLAPLLNNSKDVCLIENALLLLRLKANDKLRSFLLEGSQFVKWGGHCLDSFF